MGRKESNTPQHNSSIIFGVKCDERRRGEKTEAQTSQKKLPVYTSLCQ
jgi:hypothetical protein